MQLSASGESQPFVVWQAASATPTRSWRPPRDPAAQPVGKHSGQWPVMSQGIPGSLGPASVVEVNCGGLPGGTPPYPTSLLLHAQSMWYKRLGAPQGWQQSLQQDKSSC